MKTKRPAKRPAKKARPTREPFMLFGVEHTQMLCPLCGLASGFLRTETMMPVPKEARAPMSRYKQGVYICFDCAAAEGLVNTQTVNWYQARVAVANDRQEKLRLPGAPYGLPTVVAARPGDLERLQAWQRKNLICGKEKDD